MLKKALFPATLANHPFLCADCGGTCVSSRLCLCMLVSTRVHVHVAVRARARARLPGCMHACVRASPLADLPGMSPSAFILEHKCLVLPADGTAFDLPIHVSVQTYA